MILPILFFILIRFVWVFRIAIMEKLLQWRETILKQRDMIHGGNEEGSGKALLYRDIRFNDDDPIELTRNQEFTMYRRKSEDTSSLKGANIGSWDIYSLSLDPSYRYQLIVRSSIGSEPDRVISMNELLSQSPGRIEIEDISEWVYTLPSYIADEIQTPGRSSISLRMGGKKLNTNVLL